MTIEQAQRIMGPEVAVRFWYNGPSLSAVAINKESLEIEGSGISDLSTRSDRSARSVALKNLVASVYFHRSRKMFKHQKFRCADCGLLKPLQIHHIVHRSKGRDDREKNLTGICSACHQKEHGQ